MKGVENNNFAYIDGANLHKGIKDMSWELDYRRFRIWLKEKYSVCYAYLFIGLIPRFEDLYRELQTAYLDNQKSIIGAKKEKAPDVDETA